MTCFITTATYKNVINWPRYIGTWLLPLSTSDYSGKVGLNLALGLVTSCYSRKTVFGRPVYCWLRWGYTMSIGDPYEATRVLMDGLKRSSHGMGQLTKGLTNDCFKTRCICCCFKIKCCILSLVLLFHLSLSLSLLIEKQVFHFDTMANQICAQTSATLLIGLEGDRYLSLSWFSYFCFSAYSHCHNINRSCFVLSTLTHVRDICFRQGLFTLTANQIQTSYRIVSRSDWPIMLKTHLNLIPEHILLADRYLWLPTM